MMALLKLLCLHGYTQNATVFSKQTAVIRKALKSSVEFVYLSAPRYADDAFPETDESSRKLAWWEAKTSKEPHRGMEYHGFEETLSYIVDFLEKEGPFDGALGFSQGAILAATLSASLRDNCLHRLSTSHPSLKIAIMISGFKMRDLAYEKYFDPGPIETHSLHVLGTGDKLVPSEHSLELSSYFKNPTILEHSGGHYVPSDTQNKRKFIEFFQQIPPKI